MLQFWREHRLYIIMAALNLAILVGVVYLLRRPEPRIVAVTTPAPRVTPTAAMIEVQVHGEVMSPGVYQLPLGSRVADALEKAGGALTTADLDQLNLARKLNDGENIDVPVRAVALTAPTSASTPAAATASAAKGTPIAKININTASVAELQALPRIGVTIAQRIVDYRNQNGPFKKLEDLKNVKGIGEALFDGIKDLITL